MYSKRAMSSDTKIEIEVVESLRRLCRTLRSNRLRPELAIPAAQWETRLNARLEELEQTGGPVVASLERKEEVAA